jgi:hypothetical protein
MFLLFSTAQWINSNILCIIYASFNFLFTVPVEIDVLLNMMPWSLMTIYYLWMEAVFFSLILGLSYRIILRLKSEDSNISTEICTIFNRYFELR